MSSFLARRSSGLGSQAQEDLESAMPPVSTRAPDQGQKSLQIDEFLDQLVVLNRQINDNEIEDEDLTHEVKDLNLLHPTDV
jgi:hypothetical protein